MKNFNSRFISAFFALLTFSLLIQAQNRLVETFAITNARVVNGMGATTERSTIIIRNGLIESVGENIKIPADARLIDGSGLTVYPGFIDSNTSLAISAPPRPAGTATPGQSQSQQATQQQAALTNSNFPNGLQPETTAAGQLRAGDAQFESIRNFGFTTALTVSRDGIFNGQSALINLTGDTVSEMIVADPVAMHVTFRTLGGGTFPTSLMGTFAALRQMLLDAQRLQQVKKMYDANPRGIPRPQSDRSLEALIPVLNRTMPVAFNASTEREIVRALDLAKEFNLKAIIVGGQEAWKVANRLKAQDVPVLLSLNFPKRTTFSSPEADPESLDVLRTRVETPKGAARLAQAGVKFAFQNGGMTNLGDFLTNAAKTVENGLTREAAIRAMTLTPAEIFGVDNRLGSIEKGKIANLVVSRGDVLAKDKTITHVFVDGRLFEQKPPQQQPTRPTTTTPGTTPAFASVNGNWSLTIEIPNQPLPATLNLVQDGRNLTGTMQFQNNSVQIKDGEVTNDGFRFSATVEFQGTSVPIVVAGKVTGNQMSGTVTAPPGAIPFSGTRNP